MSLGSPHGESHRPAFGATALSACAAVVCLALVGCNDGNVFSDQVAPILAQNCGATMCHGVGPHAVANGDTIDWDKFFFRVDSQGNVVDMGALYTVVKRVINTDEDPRFSTLLRKTLPLAYGGLGHRGGANFASPQASEYQTLLEWAASETDGGEKSPPLTDREQYFAEHVQPVLVGASCGNANCHGARTAIPYHLNAGLDGNFSRAQTKSNYVEARRMLALDSDPTLSRLIRKSLPLHDGGIVHKGTNNIFFTGLDDPRVESIVDWACLERSETTGEPCEETGPAVRGFVFVRGPLAPRDIFDLDVFQPGTEIVHVDMPEGDWDAVSREDESILTGAFGAEPTDARDPAINPAGTHMAFAARRSATEGHAIYLMDLATGEATRLTEHGGVMPGGGMRTDRDPTFGPDGHVWFVSTRAGSVADGGHLLDADLYELDPATGEVLRRTVTPHIERKPTFYTTGKVSGEVAFTALRGLIPEQAHAHPFRFPPNMAAEYHQHFGTTPIEDLFYDMRELPDGRYITTVGDLTGVWGGGQLGIVDRNIGPEINSVSAATPPSLPTYVNPLTLLDPDAATSGESRGVYRDAIALPDGRLLTAYAPEVMDLADPTAAPSFRIELLALKERVDSRGPMITARRTVVDTPQSADRDPELIVSRVPVPKSEKLAWDPDESHGLLVHQGMPFINAIVSNLPPTGDKPLRDDYRFVRVVEAQPLPPSVHAPLATSGLPNKMDADGATVSDGTFNSDGMGTTVALGPHGANRILAELPLASDDSFQARIPAGISFRLQGLNADRVAVGTMHNRWFYVFPGQKLPQGVRTNPGTVYRAQCAPCHGSQTGIAEETFGPPDVITMASITLSRFEDGNPNRPIAPPETGDATRIEVDYRTDVQPILDASCATTSCHSGDAPAAELDLGGTLTDHFSVSYEALLAPGEGSGSGRRYVDALNGSAFSSFLAEKLLGKEMGAERELPANATPHPGETDGVSPLDETDRLTLIRWMDLGATFRGDPTP